MMIAAIYARKSTDDPRDIADKSVTRQIEEATAFAERRGWQVAPEYIYVDDGVSGAEYARQRALHRLQAALDPAESAASQRLQDRRSRAGPYVGSPETDHFRPATTPAPSPAGFAATPPAAALLRTLAPMR